MRNNTQAYIALGSNLADPKNQILTAIKAIEQLESSQLISRSSLYISQPMGPSDQPQYINAVIQISTNLQPIVLLDKLQTIELEHGRVRKNERWGARTLDLDILLIDNLKLNTKRLTVPHYGMKERNFVLIPLLEIAPNLVLPSGEKVANLAAQIGNQGITKL